MNNWLTFSCEELSNLITLCVNVCWQPPKDSNWILVQKWMRSSDLQILRKPLPADRYIYVCLKQSVIRNNLYWHRNKRTCILYAKPIIMSIFLFKSGQEIIRALVKFNTTDKVCICIWLCYATGQNQLDTTSNYRNLTP